MFHIVFHKAVSCYQIYYINPDISCVFPDFAVSNQDAGPAAWIATRPSQAVVTTPWTAFAANCRPFSGAVSGSPTRPSRYPNSPPAATTAHSVDSGATWRLSWRRECATETRGRGGKDRQCRAPQLPRRPAWVRPSPCPLRGPGPPIPPRRLTSPTPSWARWENREARTGAIWDRRRCGRGAARRPQLSPETPPISPSSESNARARRRTGARLWVAPSLHITAPLTWTSAQRSRETPQSVSCPIQLWLWRDCPWEMEVRQQLDLLILDLRNRYHLTQNHSTVQSDLWPPLYSRRSNEP